MSLDSWYQDMSRICLSNLWYVGNGVCKPTNITGYHWGVHLKYIHNIYIYIYACIYTCIHRHTHTYIYNLRWCLHICRVCVSVVGFVQCLWDAFQHWGVSGGINLGRFVSFVYRFLLLEVLMGTPHINVPFSIFHCHVWLPEGYIRNNHPNCQFPDIFQRGWT